MSVVDAPVSGFIAEFPHAQLIVNYNAYANVSFGLDRVWDALHRGVDALELDLRFRAADRAVACNHEVPTAQSPTLVQALDLILCWKADSPTVHRDGHQFFVMLDLKEVSNDLFDGVLEVLGRYTAHLSTAVGPNDPPRGITAVITGARGSFEQRIAVERGLRAEMNRLCVVEEHNYAGEVVNRSPGGAAFQWATYQHPAENRQVNRRHRAGFNVRTWGAENDPAALADQLATGVDSVNARPDFIQPFQALMQGQSPRGSSPSLSVGGGRTLLVWRGPVGNDLYAALGGTSQCTVDLPRRINLTWFLEDGPLAAAPSGALMPDGRVIIVYEGTLNQRLWYVSGALTEVAGLTVLQGGQHRLTLPADAGRRGTVPAVAVAPDGRVIVMYQGTDGQRLWYVSGFLNGQGELEGPEFLLSDRPTRSGHTPGLAVDANGEVIVAYAGADRLRYISGSVDADGRIQGEDFPLAEDDTGRGSAPSVTFDADGRVVIAYQGTDSQSLWYVSGYRNQDGRIVGHPFQLTEGNARRGTHPTVACPEPGRAVILYQGTSAGRLWYVHGELDAQGKLTGQEWLLDMSLEPALRFASRG